MTLILVNECKTAILAVQILNAPFNDLLFGLYTNSPVLSVDTVLADLTEQTGTGYSRQACTPFGSPTLQPSDHALSNSPPVVFSNTGLSAWDTSNGWFTYSPGSSLLVHVGTFDTPFSLAPGEDKTQVLQELFTGEDLA